MIVKNKFYFIFLKLRKMPRKKKEVVVDLEQTEGSNTASPQLLEEIEIDLSLPSNLEMAGVEEDMTELAVEAVTQELENVGIDPFDPKGKLPLKEQVPVVYKKEISGLPLAKF